MGQTATILNSKGLFTQPKPGFKVVHFTGNYMEVLPGILSQKAPDMSQKAPFDQLEISWAELEVFVWAI